MPFRKNATYSQRPSHAARAAHAKGERMFRSYDTTAIQPKRSPVPAVAALVAVVAVLAVVIYLIASFVTGGFSDSKLLPEGETATIVVAEGEGAQAIGRSLSDAHLVGSVSAFTDRVNALNAGSSLKPGTYEIAGGTSVDDIVNMLVAGPKETTFTIPEGSTLKNTADIVENSTGGVVTAADFLKAASDASAYASDYPFLKDAGSKSLEGFLFPKTYAFTSSLTADSLVRAMLDQFGTETAGLDFSYPQSKGLSVYDALKLASIVEKESDADHRATVASVFYNRLASNMRLQSDATVAYFVGHDPTAADVATPDPYNTYTIDGLTPTPICAPSIESLAAVCSPAETSYLYFYFAKDDSGVMRYYFSETYEQHEATYA